MDGIAYFPSLVKASTESQPSLLQNGETPWLPGFFEQISKLRSLEHALAKVRVLSENVNRKT